MLPVYCTYEMRKIPLLCKFNRNLAPFTCGSRNIHVTLLDQEIPNDLDCFTYHRAHRRTGEIFLGGRSKIARKILLHKNMHMIRSTINILLLVFTYFIICLRDKKIVTMILKTVAFLCKTVCTSWYTTNQGIQIHCKWFG